MEEQNRNQFSTKGGKNVILLGIVSFLNDLSSEMIMPILPFFITALGGGGLIVGLIGGLRDALSSILKVFSGYWSDKLGKRKVFVFWGYLTSAIFKLLLAFSTIWQHILIFASLERVGKGLRTAPRDAIIADSMPKERGRGFGIHRAMDTLGAVAGSLTVFFLFWFFRFSFRSLIFIASVLALFSLIPLHFVKEKKKKLKPADSFKVKLKDFSPSLKLFLFSATLFALANFSYMFFVLRSKEFFPGRLAFAVPILLYILLNVFYALFAFPAGALSDKIGRKKVIAGGYFLFSLTLLGFAFFHSLLAFLFLFALYGIVQAIIDGNQRAFVSDLSFKEQRATALGFFHTLVGLVALPASLIAGFFWQTNPQFPFLFASFISLVSVISLFFLKIE